MTARIFSAVAGALMVALALPAAVHAADAAPAQAATSSEGADQVVIESAMNAMGSGGYPALAPFVDRLKAVMSHAPDSYPLIDTRGPTVIIHAADIGEYMTVDAALSAEAQQGGTPRKGSVWTPNTYGLGALLLSGYYDEMQQYADAEAVLARAIKMQPGNWMLTLEYAACMMAQHRQAEAVAAIQETLDHPAILSNEGRARLLRNKGVALIDLNRLDEAQTALNESIRLLPDNPQARNELQYIARLRAGQRRDDATIHTVPATGNPPANSGDAAPNGQ